MFTQSNQTENDDLDLENPLDDKKGETGSLIPHDNFIHDLNVLRLQIQESKGLLVNRLGQISYTRQGYGLLGFVTISGFTGLGLVISNVSSSDDVGPTLIIGCVLIALGVMGSALGSDIPPVPWERLRCIKYPPLNTLLNIDTKTIIETIRIANSYFSSVPIMDEKKDSAAVLRSLYEAEKKVDMEIKTDHKKRGVEVLSVMTRIGVFACHYGPVQKTILEYSIPDKSIVDSLVLPQKK